MVKALEELADALSRLPTIGRKTAWRLAMHMLERDQEELSRLADCIAGVKDRVLVCKRCYNLSESEVCPICSSATRDSATICVVEKPVDVFTIESSGRYRGVYHVLGGVLSPINGITADKLRIAELEARVQQHKPAELIMGLGGSADAETTALYLAKLFSGRGLRITRLARGLPAGIELEYVDQLTLSQALNERIDVHYE
jgi:recombination protein RecR